MILLELVAAAALSGASPAAAPAPRRDGEAATLAALNAQVIGGYALRRDTSGYRAHAHPAYRLVYAPGIVENLEMVIAGVDQLDLQRFDLETLSVDLVGDAALILSRVDARGTVAGHEFPERVAMTHYWVREGGAWKLLGESMTPILVPDAEFERMRGEALGPR